MTAPAKGTTARAKPAQTKPAKSNPAKSKQASKPAAKAAAAPAKTPPGPWSQALPTSYLQGFGFGVAYPSVIFHCQVPPTTPQQRAELAQRFDALFDGAKSVAKLELLVDPAQGSGREDTEAWFAAIAARLQQLADLPVHSPVKVIGRTAGGTSFVIPALARGIKPTSELLVLACRAFAATKKGEIDKLRPRVHAEFAQLLGSALTTSNTPRLVKAAVENGITFQELPGSLVLYGIGRKAVLMDSTFTHYCSNVGARLAKYKHLGTGVLRRAGLPAPSNLVVNSEEQALAAAHQFGFPVVVKPADKDGGIGVQADLRTDDEVRAAFAAAQKVSKMVMVEKFVSGRDYRITVFRGKAIWAVERMPASVSGDGSSTIRQLVAAVNEDPRRGSTVYAALKKIKLDPEAEALLARDGLTPDSVPAAGRFVRLRRSSNVSSGGMPVVVTETMHSDNARLAERAAAVIGLDLAGIDLIIPDIATSWRACEAGICEVNAQPELGGVTAGHLYPLVLKSLVRGNGHIPTIGIFGGARADAAAAELAALLKQSGVTAGIHDRTGVRVGQETILEGETNPLRGGRILTMDSRVEAIVLGGLDARVLQHGLPVDRFDALLLAGDAPPTPDFAKGQRGQMLGEALRLILPYCRTVAALAPLESFDAPVKAAVEQTARIGRFVPESDRATFLGGVASQIATAVRQPAGRAHRRQAAAG